jgi:hypothetical protein
MRGYLINTKQLVERETEVLEGNLIWYHSVDHKTHMTWPELEPGPPKWRAVDSCHVNNPYLLQI